MPEPLVRYALAGRTAVITLDDGKANALSVPVLDQLLAALDRAESEAGAVVLAGRPDRFCAGFDLRVMTSGPEAAVGLLRRGSEVLLRLFELPLPLVVAVTGHALAGGALVVLTGDLRIGADGPYKIGLNEVAIGLPVPLLAMELARARLVPTELTRATLLARIYDPVGALAAGYLDRIVSAETLAHTAHAEAEELAKFARPAFSGTKDRLRRAVVERIRSGFEEDVARILPG